MRTWDVELDAPVTLTDPSPGTRAFTLNLKRKCVNDTLLAPQNPRVTEPCAASLTAFPIASSTFVLSMFKSSI